MAKLSLLTEKDKAAILLYVGKSTLNDRDKEIIRSWCNGETTKNLSLKHNISLERIRQIISKLARPGKLKNIYEKLNNLTS